MMDHYSFFDSYTASFLQHDASFNYHIQLKCNHSIRVANLARQIAQTESSDPYTIYIAELCGLYHDIARFTQFAQYKTFTDAHSIDHGTYGAELVKSLEIFNTLTPAVQEILTYTIAHHNKIRIPDLKDEKTYYTSIIRDADKLDIFHVLLEEFESDNPELQLQLPDTNSYSYDIVEAVLTGTQISYTKRQSLNDMKLTMLNWIHDLSFQFSFEYILDNEYITRTGKTLPHDSTIKSLLDHVTEYAHTMAYQHHSAKSFAKHN